MSSYGRRAPAIHQGGYTAEECHRLKLRTAIAYGLGGTPGSVTFIIIWLLVLSVLTARWCDD
jgi:hypothetical protein